MSNSLNTISLAADVGLRRPIDPRTGDLTNPAGRPEALFFGETVTLAVDFFTRTPAGNGWELTPYRLAPELHYTLAGSMPGNPEPMFRSADGAVSIAGNRLEFRIDTGSEAFFRGAAAAIHFDAFRDRKLFPDLTVTAEDENGNRRILFTAKFLPVCQPGDVPESSSGSGGTPAIAESGILRNTLVTGPDILLDPAVPVYLLTIAEETAVTIDDSLLESRENSSPVWELWLELRQSVPFTLPETVEWLPAAPSFDQPGKYVITFCGTSGGWLAFLSSASSTKGEKGDTGPQGPQGEPGPTGSGTGDMLKSVYDTNDDGIVDHAATADAVGATTAAQVADAVGKAHTHANKATLDKLTEADGKLTFDGAEIGGGSGTVKSVNGQLPDESGNVTVETGGVADESRLLPDVSGLTQPDDGKVMQFKFTSAEAGTPFCCNCQTLASGGNNQLVNESGGATITMNGVALNQDVEGPFGGASVGGFYFSSMSDASSVVIQPAPAVDADSDLTLEYWLYPNKDTLNYCTILRAKTASGVMLDRLNFSDGALEFANKGIIPASAISSLAVTLGKWHHIAISRKNQITRLFIDGVKVGEGSTAWSILAEEEIKWCFYAAANTNSGNCRCGGFQYSRSALYENDFEVPTAPFSVNAGREMVLDFMREATTSKAGAMSAADKAKLDSISTSSVSWYTISDANTITLDRANGELQKVTLTQNCTLTAPVLDADHPMMLLQVTSASAVTVTVGETQIWSGSGTFQVGWFYDGETTRRYPVVEVA